MLINLVIKVIFLTGQWIYMILMLLPVPLFFYFRYLEKFD